MATAREKQIKLDLNTDKEERMIAVPTPSMGICGDTPIEVKALIFKMTVLVKQIGLHSGASPIVFS